MISGDNCLCAQEHLKVLANLESQLDDLDGLGQQLSRDCVKADGEVIQQRIADLRSVHLSVRLSWSFYFNDRTDSNNIMKII